ncbi:hypothetical protein WG66_004455 [Moniliophthora roreri]|nr:hypothetical protein WG66_004455 [Moniliophthora roreri]
MDSFSTLDTLLHLEEEEAFTTPAYDGEQSTIPVNEERPGTVSAPFYSESIATTLTFPLRHRASTTLDVWNAELNECPLYIRGSFVFHCPDFHV